ARAGGEVPRCVGRLVSELRNQRARDPLSGQRPQARRRGARGHPTPQRRAGNGRRSPPSISMAEQLRLAELMAALSLATDLEMGQPLEQALRTCLIAVALGERLGLANDGLSEVHYVALLPFLGCTADAHEFAAMVGGDDIASRAALAAV